MSGRVYMKGLANVLGTNTAAIGRTLNEDYLAKIKFYKETGAQSLFRHLTFGGGLKGHL